MTKKPTAIVTGASRGIGRAVALGLAKDGYRVAALARTKKDLEALAAEASGQIDAHAADLSRLDELARIVGSIAQEFGSVDVLVNNAALGGQGTLEVPADKFEELLNVNLTAQFRILQEIVPIMKRRGSGHIFNVASQAGKIGFAGYGAYGASKFGLVGLGQSLYRELCPHGIKVTTLCPSWVDTKMAQDGGTPLAPHEMIQPDDIMKTVRWLLSLSPAACVSEVSIECAQGIE